MSRIDGCSKPPAPGCAGCPPREVPAALRAGRGAWSTSARRPSAQREGEVPAALVIERNVLEWRCDPTSDARLPQAVGDDVEWVVLCSEGYTSSLAAASLLDLGLHRATDVDRRLPRAEGRRRAGLRSTERQLGVARRWSSSGRSFSVFSGVQPGGCRIAAHASATSLT